MTDRQAVALAVAVAVGAAAARGPTPLAGLLVVAVAFAVHRPWVLVLGAALLASALGERAWAATGPLERSPFAGTVTLVDDPVVLGGAVRVEVKAGGERLEAWARGPAIARLASRLGGQRVVVRGEVGPLPPSAEWLKRRHITGRLTVDEVDRWDAGTPLARAANAVRTWLTTGAAGLADAQRALFLGIVLGDTRQQTAAQADDFQAAGLTHLLAVSGENVAFVLALLRPLLSRLALGTRLAATCGALAFFALVTRFEPSVLRAVAMAAFAALGATLGREASGVRVLALAVTALLLLDPLLVGVVGFQLSVAATAGIILLAPRIASVLPGPAPLRNAIGVTVAAQIAVAPVLVPVFGGLPVVAMVANVLAAPAAGPVMMWGWSGGLVAGLRPEAGWILHLPTAVLLTWIRGVAAWCAHLPWGEWRVPHLAAFALAGAGLWWSRRHSRPILAALAVTIALAAAVAPALALRRAPPVTAVAAPGIEVWRPPRATAPAAVVIEQGARPRAPDVLLAMRRAGVRDVAVVIIERPSVLLGDVLLALQDRYHPPLVLAPAGWFVPGARPAVAGAVISASGLRIEVLHASPTVAVRVTRTGATERGLGPRGPPRRRCRFAADAAPARRPRVRHHDSRRRRRHPQPNA